MEKKINEKCAYSFSSLIWRNRDYHCRVYTQDVWCPSIYPGVVEGVIEASQGVKLIADESINNINSEKFDSMILHGGQPWTDNVKKILGSLHFYRKWKVKKNNRCNLCGTNSFRGKWTPQKTLKTQSSIGQRNIIRGFVYGEQRWLTTTL